VSSTGEGFGFIVAADAGGSHTRVACYGLDGTLLGLATGPGGNPHHNADAVGNVADTTLRALHLAGLDARDAVSLVAGLANISRPGSNQGSGNNGWADEFFTVPTLGCDPIIVNDAVIAHRGAFLGQPGVMVVAGTGSMILAITKDGTEVESGQFEHYAGGARHLVFETMQLILIGEAGAEDAELVESVLDYWGATDIPDLRKRILNLAGSDPLEVRRRYGLLAPTVSAAADTSPLADRALRDLAGKTARGVRLLAPLLERQNAPVATAGALASTPTFRSRLSDALTDESAHHPTLVATQLNPLGGAALIAYERAGIQVTPDLIERLLTGQMHHPEGMWSEQTREHR
jgi:glucosamine kinase